MAFRGGASYVPLQVRLSPEDRGATAHIARSEQKDMNSRNTGSMNETHHKAGPDGRRKDKTEGDHAARHTISVLGRQFPMPRSRRLRVVIGVVLVILGMFGFLPILGFWMIPLGVLVLSYEFATVRRFRRRFEIWWAERRGRRRARKR